MQVQTLPYSKFVEDAQNERMPKQYQDIADRLIEVREILGMNQVQFARKAKLGARRLNNWETGRYRISLNGALRLRETYGLPLDFIYCGSVDMLPNKIASALASSPRDNHSR